MSTFFNTNQPQTANVNIGLFGNNPNQQNFQTVGLNNQQVNQNLLLNNVQQHTLLDSRSTVRQLTSLVPEWKGHFDLADHLMTSQEQTLTNVSLLVTQLQNIYENLVSTFDFSKTSLNDINLQQDKLNNDLSERLKYQDLQNLVTIKSRRLCEVIIGNHPSTDVSSAFRIPNHINVQVSKELYERVKNLKNEIDFIQNEVQLLKEIDVFQAPTFIDSVLTSHDSRITNLGDSLTKLLNKAESVLNKDLKREVWSGLTVDSSTLRKNFLDAIGFEQPKTEPESVSLTEVKKQINYLKKFNSSYNDPNLQYMKDYGYNIKDLLVNTVPNQSLMMPTPNYLANGLNPVTGAPNLFGQQFNQNQPFGSNQFGLASGLGGTTGFGTTAETGGFGQTGFGAAQPTTGLNTFGSSGNLLQSSTGSCNNLYAQQFQKQQPVGNTQYGFTTTGFGGTTTGFGTGMGTTGTGFGGTQTPFGMASGTTMTQPSTGLFGNTTNTGLGSSTLGTNTGLFGNTTTTGTTGLGGTTTGFGTTQETSGFGQTGFGGTQNQSSNLLFHSSTGTGSSANLLGYSNTTTQPSTGLFGNTTTTGTTTTGPFGSSTTTGFGSNTGTGFGNTAFGTSTTTTGGSTGLFGNTSTNTGFGTTTQPGTGTGLFGGTNTSGSSLFGSSSTTTQPSTGLFGSSTTATPGFGSNTTSTGLFGNTTNTGTTGLGGSSSNLFGSTTTSSSLFGGTTQSKPPGTELALYTNPTPSFIK